VLGLVAEGATTREISERLFISAKTADNHIQHIYTKLGVTNRAAATRWAFDRGLVESERDGDAE
jgi:DNA-binding NarL/FixJ family response regulator